MKYTAVITALIGLHAANLAAGEVSKEDHAFYPGDYSKKQIIGNSLPGTWRPFSRNSPWNTPIAANAKTHPDSAKIMATVLTQAKNLRLANVYTIPVWVINSNNMPKVKVHSMRIFETWDKDHDRWADDGLPLKQEMWGEPTTDGHICIVDPFKNLAWEMSKFKGLTPRVPASG